MKSKTLNIIVLMVILFCGCSFHTSVYAEIPAGTYRRINWDDMFALQQGSQNEPLYLVFDNYNGAPVPLCRYEKQEDGTFQLVEVTPSEYGMMYKFNFWGNGESLDINPRKYQYVVPMEYSGQVAYYSYPGEYGEIQMNGGSPKKTSIASYDEYFENGESAMWGVYDESGAEIAYVSSDNSLQLFRNGNVAN